MSGFVPHQRAFLVATSRYLFSVITVLFSNYQKVLNTFYRDYYYVICTWGRTNVFLPNMLRFLKFVKLYLSLSYRSMLSFITIHLNVAIQVFYADWTFLPSTPQKKIFLLPSSFVSLPTLFTSSCTLTDLPDLKI